MPELGFVVYLVAISYAMGMLWHTLLGRNDSNWVRIMAFPLLGIVIGEAVWGKYLSDSVGSGLVFFNVHLYIALVATFIATLVDMAFGWLSREHPIANTFKGLGHSHQTSHR